MIVRRVFRVEGMHCPNCVMRVESIEDDTPGVKRVAASYKEGRMVVEFDEPLITEAEIIAEVARLDLAVSEEHHALTSRGLLSGGFTRPRLSRTAQAGRTPASPAGGTPW